MAREKATRAQIFEWFDTLSNWGRWGKDDLMGTLNNITPEKRLQGMRTVTEGISISCGLPIVFNRHNLEDDWPEPRHFMIHSGDWEPPAGYFGRTDSADAVMLNCHGLTLTHLDGPAHTFWQSAADRPRTMYNGFPATLVTTREGCTVGDVALAGAGIVSRGVLLDIARLRGVDWLEPRTPIFPEDLEEAEAAQGVRVEPGDILCINSGHAKRKRHVGWNTDPVVEQAGPDGACLPWLKERDVALLACDTANDWFPPDPGMPPRPVHGVGMSSLGLWLIDGADYEELSEACARLGRWEFLYTVSPLRLTTATASPVNPIAIL